jgi:hypothetical protein
MDAKTLTPLPSTLALALAASRALYAPTSSVKLEGPRLPASHVH